jgi:hypothetical protein
MKIEIIHSKDKDGRAVVSVPVAKTDKRAVLYQEDWNLLQQLGVSPNWIYRLENVYSGSSVSIGAVLADAQPMQQVNYLDKDKFNLRRDNLILSVGNRKFAARDLIPSNSKIQKFELERTYAKQDQKAETAMIE